MKRVFIAGHNGMVGKSIYNLLEGQENIQVITYDRKQLDLIDQRAVENFFKSERPDEVILCAARVGGINANNTYPADFIYENLQIQNNVIHFSHLYDVQKLLFLGSSCIYPKFAEQPITENSLLTGLLEKTNEPYAIAKIAGIKMCESYNMQFNRDYRCVMPTNLYGPGDNYNLDSSHVIPALIRKFYDAKKSGSEKVVIWGTGKPMREFLFVDDMAEASLYIHNLPKDMFYKDNNVPTHINIGTGKDTSIEELAKLIAYVTGFDGSLDFDESMPDGTPRKLLNIELLTKLGWKAKTSLLDGLKLSYDDFLLNYDTLRL